MFKLLSYKQLEETLAKYNFHILISGNEIQTQNSALYNETTRFELLQKEKQGIILPKLFVAYTDLEMQEDQSEEQVLQQMKNTLLQLESEIGTEVRLEGIIHHKQENKMKLYLLMQQFGLKSFFWSDEHSLQTSREAPTLTSAKETTEQIPISEIKLPSKM